MLHIIEGQAERHTRSTADPLNLRPKAARLRRNFFTNRVVEDWNKIPLEVRKAKTVISFKNGYALHRARLVESTWTEEGVCKKWSVDHTYWYSLRGPTSYPYKTRHELCKCGGYSWFCLEIGYAFSRALESRERSACRIFSRVSDPHWFNADPDTDPDPAFFLIADPDSGSSRIRIPIPPGSGSRIRIQGWMT